MEPTHNDQEDKSSQEITADTKNLPTLEELRASEQRYQERKSGNRHPAEPSPAGKEYIEKMKKLDREPAGLSLESLMRDFDKSKPRRIFHGYPFEPLELLPLATEIYTAKLATVGRKPIWDGPTSEIFQNMVRYFTGDPLSPYDLGKGIYLFGGVGVGKSMLLQTFQDFTKLIETRITGAVLFTSRSFKITECRDISTEIQASDKVDLRPYYKGVRVFDDLGNEPDKKHFGNEISPMVDILLARYTLYQTGGLVTHTTSNLAPHECQAVYGDRIGSRVFEMFNLVLLDTADKRKI